jgi:hypothetical protein
LVRRRFEQKLRRDALKRGEIIESAWRAVGIPDDAWPGIRQRWASEPWLEAIMLNYPVASFPPARLKSLVLEGDYATLLRETEAVLAEVPFRQWCSQRAVCPRCRGAGIHIVSGYADRELLEASRRGDVALYGCLYPPDANRWRCKRCRYKW